MCSAAYLGTFNGLGDAALLLCGIEACRSLPSGDICHATLWASTHTFQITVYEDMETLREAAELQERAHIEESILLVRSSILSLLEPDDLQFSGTSA